MTNNKRRTARSYFTNNTALKLISLLFAIILWSFVTNSTNPDRTKTIEDIPIVVQGIEFLEEKGFSIREDLSKLSTAKIKVNVKNSDYRLVNKNVIFASIDVSEISKDGVNSITVVPQFNNLADVSLESIEPQSITLTVDKIIKKEVPVKLEQTGYLKENLVSVAPEYSKAITLEGSSYYLDLIENAIVDVDLSTLNDGDIISTAVRYTDKDGKDINFDRKKIDIDMDIQTKKEVPINAHNSIINSDKLAEGYQFANISTGKITICGHADVLNTVTEINAAPIDLTGKDSTFTSTPIDLAMPDGISVLAGQEAPVAKIEIKEQQETIIVKRYITISGLSNDLVASLTSGDQTVKVSGDGIAYMEATVSLTGPKLLLNNLTESDVKVRLSLLEKGVGTYELQPDVFLSATFSNSTSAQLVSPTQISVSISTPQINNVVQEINTIEF